MRKSHNNADLHQARSTREIRVSRVIVSRQSRDGVPRSYRKGNQGSMTIRSMQPPERVYNLGHTQLIRPLIRPR
jgi:hypothetical protein